MVPTLIKDFFEHDFVDLTKKDVWVQLEGSNLDRLLIDIDLASVFTVTRCFLMYQGAGLVYEGH